MSLFQTIMGILMIWFIAAFTYGCYMSYTSQNPMDTICQQEGFEEYECENKYCNCFTKGNETVIISQDYYRCDKISSSDAIIDALTFGWLKVKCRKVI